MPKRGAGGRLVKLIREFLEEVSDHGRTPTFLQLKDFRARSWTRLRPHALDQGRVQALRAYWPLQDRTLVMIFEKPARARACPSRPACTSSAAAAIYLNTRDSQLGRGEPVEDAAQVISRMCDIVMIRTFEQDIIERFAANSRVPVINGLTNEYHPCQILADIFTFIEHRGSIQGKHRGLDRRFEQRLQHLAAGRRGVRLQGACIDAARLRSRARARRPAWHRHYESSPIRWMRARRRPGDHRRVDLDGLRGRERGAHARLRRLAGRCRHDAVARPMLFMHCLPAHRGEEVSPR
jgi:ornithine carbamoyltransferase